MGKLKNKLKNKTSSLTIQPTVQVNIGQSIMSQNVPVTREWAQTCRLCEAKDVPVLNIFDADQVMAKKMACILPFMVYENDDLPQKICYRCSAKVEELNEFIQKCVKTQENLYRAIGKNGPFFTKTKSRILWEEHLSKSNISNEDICNAVIQKALRSIQYTDTDPKINEETDIKNQNTETKEDKELKGLSFKTKEVRSKDVNSKEVKSKEVRSKDVNSKEVKSKEVRSKDIKSKEVSKDVKSKEVSKELKSKEVKGKEIKSNEVKTKEVSKEVKNIGVKESKELKTYERKTTPAKPTPATPTPATPTPAKPTPATTTPAKPTPAKPDDSSPVDPKPFNIMDHVTSIKVTGVGTLFQCHLCKRNFMSMDVVAVHGCTKKREPVTKTPPLLSTLPKTISVKYINTNTKPDLPQNNQVEETKTPVTKPHRPGPKSRVCPSVPQDIPKMNPDLVIKRKQKEEPQKIPTKVKKTEPSDSTTLSNYQAKPYPVGLFQTVSKESSSSNQTTFYTSNGSRKTCTVIRTANPSKLIISTKRVDDDEGNMGNKQINRNAPKHTAHPFTFINVDPLLEPLYVLPTDTRNTIQEQPREHGGNLMTNYNCPMCKKVFSREQKLLVHIQSHYNKED